MTLARVDQREFRSLILYLANYLNVNFLTVTLVFVTVLRADNSLMVLYMHSLVFSNILSVVQKYTVFYRFLPVHYEVNHFHNCTLYLTNFQLLFHFSTTSAI